MTRRALASVAVLTLALGACTAPEPGGDDAGPGVDAGPQGVTLEFVLKHYHFDADGEMVEAIAPDATLVVDHPDGRRVERTPGADGRVEVEDVVWSAGGLFLTLLRDGCVLNSVPGFDQSMLADMQAESDDGVAELWAPCFGDNVAPTTVTVSGSALNMVDAAHQLTVSSDASPADSAHQAAGPGWSIEVFPDRPFTIVALEWDPPETRTVSNRGIERVYYRWTVLEHAGVSADTALELDFAASRTATHFGGRVALPVQPVGDWSTSVAYVSIYQREGTLFLGAITRSDVTSDGLGFEYEGEYVALDGVDVEQHYGLYPGGNAASDLFIESAPTLTAQIDGMLEPMVVEPPAVPGVPYSLDGRLSWQRNPVDAAEANLMQQLTLYRPTGVGGMYALVWNFTLPKTSAATEIVFPALPEGFDRGSHFGTQNLLGQLLQLERRAQPGARPLRSAKSKVFTVAP